VQTLSYILSRKLRSCCSVDSWQSELEAEKARIARLVGYSGM